VQSLACVHIAAGFDLGFDLRMSLDSFVPILDLGMALNPCRDILAASRFVVAPPLELTQSLAQYHLVHICACLHYLQRLHLVLEAALSGRGALSSSFCSIASLSVAARRSSEHLAVPRNYSQTPFCHASQLLSFDFVFELLSVIDVDR
jgi:hypothetical protein